jgi:hypothetical protein
MGSLESWQTAFDVAFQAQADWQLPAADRHEVVPGAATSRAHYVNPYWTSYPQVKTIGDHTFYKVDKLRSS